MVAKVLSITRGRIYYGWTIVAVGFAIECMFVSLRSYGFPLFFKPMTEELGWTRAMYSSIQSLGTMIDGVLSPFVGPIIDKRGARGLMVFGLAVGGAGFVALGFVHGILDFFLVRSIAITIGITCAGPVVVNVAISNWFIRKRGRAVSLGLTGVSLGGVLLSPLAIYLIASYGWRLAWIVLGVLLWVVTIPLVAIFVRRRPEDIGLLPDGDPYVGVGSQGSGIGGPAPGPRPLTPLYEVTWTRGEAARTSALWLNVLAFGLVNFANGGLMLHFFAYLSDIGLTEGVAIGAFSTFTASMLISKLGWGMIIDKYDVRHCSMSACVVLGLATSLLGLLSLWSFPWLAYFSVIFMGLGMAGQQPVQEVLWANYFGRLSLGAVRSIAAPFTLIFSAGGPFFAGWAYDRLGDYHVPFAVFAFATFVAAVLIYFSRRPQKRSKERVEDKI